MKKKLGFQTSKGSDISSLQVDSIYPFPLSQTSELLVPFLVGNQFLFDDGGAHHFGSLYEILQANFANLKKDLMSL